MALDLTAVVSGHARVAEQWCVDNGLDSRLACSTRDLDIRLMGIYCPVVKVLGDVDDVDLEDIAYTVEMAAGRLV